MFNRRKRSEDKLKHKKTCSVYSCLTFDFETQIEIPNKNENENLKLFFFLPAFFFAIFCFGFLNGLTPRYF